MTVNFEPDQLRRAQEFVSYTFRDMARLCATYGWDESRAQSVERLQADLTPAPLGYRRSMVVGRQLFFFSHAYRLTGDAIYREHARHLFEDLKHNFWDDRLGGWRFSTTIDNVVVDPTRDLYGYAFIMFGLAHYLAIFKDDEALKWIVRTEELVSTQFALPGGWLAHATTETGTKLGRNLEQNPHMHLLEAYLSIYRATGDEAFLGSATRVMSVYTELLRTPDGSKVLEHLDEEGRASGVKGTYIQPGHLYEWFWLVSEYADIAGMPAFKISSPPIVEWADRHCLDTEAGGIFDLVSTSADILSDRKRIWPVTERIKALSTIMRERPTERTADYLVECMTLLLEKYRTSTGGWHEYLNKDLRPDSDFMPMSSPYHVGMAALEVERLLGGPGAFGMVTTKSAHLS